MGISRKKRSQKESTTQYFSGILFRSVFI